MDRYEQAIERLKQWDREHPNGYAINERDEFIFPELKEKESEDEKIRKDIISHFAKGIEGSSFDEVREKYKIWIAWLEKQAEQELTVIIPKFKEGQTIEYIGDFTIYPELFTISKVGEEHYFDKNGFTIPIKNQDQWEPVEQKYNESDDERIRKHLIKHFGNKSKTDWNGMPVDKIIAWLEKQGSQILANSAKTCKDEQNLAEYTLEQAASIFLNALSNTPYNNKPITDAQVITKELLKFLSDAHSYNPNAINEQKPTDKKGMNLVEEEMTPFQKKVFCIIDTTIEEEQGLKQVCDELLALASNEIKQNSAEWSEEDETVLSNLIYALANDRIGNNRDEYVDWLKKHKTQFLKPQSRWNPSDEHYELEEFAKIVRGNLTGISKAVQKLFEAKYLQLTGNKMYGGFKD